MDERARPRAAAVVAALVGAALVLAGCSDDDAAGDEESTTTESTASTTTTQPPATDTEAVRPVIEDLVADFDAVQADALLDPAQLEDPESPLAADLEALFTEEALEARLATFRDNAEAGRVFEPTGPQPLWTTVLADEIVPNGENSLVVLACTTDHYRVTGPEGGEARDGFSSPGRFYFERVDGAWKVARVDENPMQFCDPTAYGGSA